MKCDKCGKTIDTNALVCPFCDANIQSPTEEIEVLDFDTVVEEVTPSTVLNEKKSSNNKKEEKKESKKEEKKKKETKKDSNKKTKKDKKENKSKESDKKENKHDNKEENKDKVVEEKHEEPEELLERLDETAEEQHEEIVDEPQEETISELSEKEEDKIIEPEEDSISEEDKLDVTNFEGTFVELPEGLVEKIELPEDADEEDVKQPIIETGETIDIASLGIQSVPNEVNKDKTEDQEPQIISSKEVTEEDKEEKVELVMEPTIIAESIQDVAELPNQSVEMSEEEHTGSYEPFVESDTIVPLPPKKTLWYRIKDFYRSWFEGYEKAPEIKVDNRETRLTLEKIYEKSTKEAQEKPVSSGDVGMVWLVCFVIAFISFFVFTVISFIVDIILGDANNTSILTVIIPLFQIGLPCFFILFGWAIGLVYSYIKRKADRNK